MTIYTSDKVLPENHIVNTSLNTACNVLNDYVTNKLNVIFGKDNRLTTMMRYRFEVGTMVFKRFYTLSFGHHGTPNPLELSYLDTTHTSLSFKAELFAWLETMFDELLNLDGEELKHAIFRIHEINPNTGEGKTIVVKPVGEIIKLYETSHRKIKVGYKHNDDSSNS